MNTRTRHVRKSNTQRQREFRERHPHYYRDLHRKRKAAIQMLAAVKAAYPELSDSQAYAVVHASSNVPVTQQAPARQTPLALPEALSEPLITVQLPLVEQAPKPVEVTRLQVTPAQVVEQLKRAA